MGNKLKRIMAFLLSIMMIFALIPTQTASAFTSLSINLGSPTLSDGKYYYSNANVEGSDIRTVLINFSDDVTSGDAIILPVSPEGFTVSESSNSYTKRINISSESAIDTNDIQSYLRSVGFSLGSDSQTVQVVVTSEDITYDTYYNATNQHYYQFVPLTNSTETWISSYNAAKSLTYMGRTGYLATVTSLQEDRFIMDLSGKVGWLGGTRMTYNAELDSFSTTETTGYWYWAGGPEKGEKFYDAQSVNSSDYITKDATAISAGYYFNWNRPAAGDQEPNSDLPVGENCLTTLFIGEGYAGTEVYSWNDRHYNANYVGKIESETQYEPRGYVVEYGNTSIGDSGSGNLDFASASGSLPSTDEEPSIDLSGISWQSATTYNCGLDLSPSSRMVSISVDRGYFNIPSLGTALTFRGGTNGSSYIKTFSSTTQFNSVVFSFTDSSAAEAALSSIVYATETLNPVQKITATSSTMAPIGSDLYFDGHFYRYVPGAINWINSVIEAGETVDPYFGGRGYIATAISQPENTILLQLTDNGSASADHWYDAWMGGLWQRNTGTVESPSIIRGTNGSEISYSTLLNATTMQRQSLLLRYSTIFPSSPDIYTIPTTVKYYWIDGPEAGLEIANNTDDFAPWHVGGGVQDEPNSGDFIYIGWEGAYWDDLSASSSSNLDGYIVEFSGFTSSNPTELIATDTITVSNVFSVTLNTDGGSINTGSIASYTYGVGATLPTDVTKTGYVFGGWYTSSNLSGSPVTTISTTDSGDKSYWAKWTANNYSITYNLNGGTNPEGTIANYNYGTGATLSVPTKTGHTFEGWYTSSDLSGSPVTSISTTDIGNKTYWAKWTTDNYTITYNLNGGTNPEGASTGYTYGVGATLPTDVTKTGYTFGGWYESSNLSGSPVTTISTTDSGDKSYWAKWTANIYTITYNLNGGTNAVGALTSYTYGTGATLLAPTKTGHTFGGWYESSDLSGPSVTAISTTDTGDKTYWAKWITNSYTITYNLNGGENAAGAPVSYTYGTGAALPTPTKIGHTFGGWYTSEALSETSVAAISTTDIGNKTYYAQWTANSYDITYNLNGGTNAAVTPVSYTYGIGATLSDPTRSGYAFSGWYESADFSGTRITSIGALDIGSKEYWAKWSRTSSSQSKTIAVTETSSSLFEGISSPIKAEANMVNAFANSVEVKVTDIPDVSENFGLGIGMNVYPFDISLYIKGTDTKTKPASGYAVTISLPVPKELIDSKEQLFVVHKGNDGTVTRLSSKLEQVKSTWYLVFEATDFSPYALVVSNLTSYDKLAGLPYYERGGGKVFIGFAADGKYLAPEGTVVSFSTNPKSFTDISAHWGKKYIDFVTEREIFMGTQTNRFSPDTGMTRAMFATVIGRLYERSYGEISMPDTLAFADLNHDAYYGKYVEWAAKNGIVQGVNAGLFKPSQQITRQEMAAMIYRFAEFTKLHKGISTDVKLEYSDASSIASWAEDAALYCQETGIITGRSGGNFAPTEKTTRGEVAAIIQRFIELVI